MKGVDLAEGGLITCVVVGSSDAVLRSLLALRARDMASDLGRKTCLLFTLLSSATWNGHP